MSGLISWIMNPWILLIILVPIVAFIFLIAGIYFSQPRKTSVAQFSPESGIGKEYEVSHEDAIYMECAPIGEEFPQRFIKTGRAYNMIKKTAFKLQNYALWLGRLGTAYTYDLPKTEEEKEPISFENAIITVFSRTHYDKLSAELKKRIAEAKIGVTVNFPRVPLAPENPNFDSSKPISAENPKSMPLVSSDDVRRGAFDKFINALASGINKLASKGQGINVVMILLGIGTGTGLACLLLLAFGRLK